MFSCRNCDAQENSGACAYYIMLAPSSHFATPRNSICPTQASRSNQDDVAVSTDNNDGAKRLARSGIALDLGPV